MWCGPFRSIRVDARKRPRRELAEKVLDLDMYIRKGERRNGIAAAQS